MTDYTDPAAVVDAARDPVTDLDAPEAQALIARCRAGTAGG